MRKLFSLTTLSFLLTFFYVLPTFALKNKIHACVDAALCRLKQIWTEGDRDLYVSGYAWHNRFVYDPERVKLYNEAAWGGGLGKSLFDEKGNWHGLYAIAFLDSHRNLEPAAGYCYLKTLHLTNNLAAGLGYTVLVTSRSDIFNSIPFPGILPWGSIFYKKAALSAAYVPGSFGAGNVLFITSRFNF